MKDKGWVLLAALAGEGGTAGLVVVDVASGAERTVIARGRNLHPSFRPVP